MSNVKKELRADDTEIKKLNHLGLSLKAIGEHVGCHGVTVSVRLKEMEVEPSDTRRSFMDKIYAALSPEEKEWLADGLYNKGMHVKDFVVALLKEAYSNRRVEQVVAPVDLPQLQPVSPIKDLPLSPEHQQAIDWSMDQMSINGVAITKINEGLVMVTTPADLFKDS